MRIIGIDPGNVHSAYAVYDPEQNKIVEFGKIENEILLEKIRNKELHQDGDVTVIEMIGHYGTGMAAGRTVFDTCIMIGRIIEAYHKHNIKTHTLLRKTIATAVSGSPKAKDGNVIQALKDRFGDRGTKAEPGFFYGVKADVWQAFAVCVAWMDLEGQENEIGL